MSDKKTAVATDNTPAVAPVATPIVGAYGPGNLKIEESTDKVTITFDPRVILGAPFSSGRIKVASTGAFMPIPGLGIRIMFHAGHIVG